MAIRRIRLTDFLSVKQSELLLGPRVTLITGANGSGKTSHLQALIWAIWGQSIRKLSGEPSVILEHDQGTLERVITPSGERVRKNNGIWQQKTKILPELEAMFGSLASWSRTLFLTGRNIGMFSQGTPAFRWDYLLKLTGAAQYDKAIGAAKTELRNAEKVLADLSTKQFDMSNLKSMQLVTWEDKRMSAMGLRNHPDPLRIAHYEATLVGLRDRQKAGEEFLQKAEARLAKIGATFDQINHDLSRKAAEYSLAKKQADLCPTCGGPVENPSVSHLEKELEEVKRSVASAREAVYRQRDVIAVNKSKLQEVRGSIQSYELTLERERDQEDNFHAMEQSILDSCLLWIATKRKLEAQEILVAEAQGAVLEKTQVVETLTQARQLYLKNFLGQINATARSYLEHIGAKAMVELVPVGDRGLELQTVGTGADSYANCSGGEQRRIDFCLALAMAEVAAGMGHLTRDVPLVVDEAFDTLDEAGITALLSLACHIAKRRQVILVSHVLPDVPLESSIVPIRLGP